MVDYVFMTEEFLDGADVVAVLQKMGGEGVPEGVAGDSLLDAGYSGGFFDGALESGGFEVVAAERRPTPSRPSPKLGEGVFHP